MKGVDWGCLYNKYKDQNLDSKKLRRNCKINCKMMM